MEDRKIKVAITHGDTNGTGYEQIFKVFADPEMLELCTPVIYGSPKVAAYHRKALDTQAAFTIISDAEDTHEGKVNLLTTFDDEVKVELGLPSKESAAAALKALDRAIADYKQGLFDVLVTSPMNNAATITPDMPFAGNGIYVATHTDDAATAVNMLVTEQIRVALATDGVPMGQVEGLLSKNDLQEKCISVYKSLKRDFGLSNPRIALLSLNPEEAVANNDTFEENIITPTIEALSAQGIQAFGPYQGDEFFGNCLYSQFDIVVAMYHDQGAIPFRLLAGEDAVEYTAGLPIICTQPCHNPQFQLAGKGTSDPTALRHAIYTAIDIYRNRDAYDEPTANPLKKLFHEKRDDSDKARFAVTKKKDNDDKESQTQAEA